MRLAVLTSHPIQYQAPLFRELAGRTDLQVFFAHRANEKDQAEAGFGIGFTWDIDLLSGYDHKFLDNTAVEPSLEHFAGCDTPTVGAELARGQFDALLVMGWHLKSFWQGIWGAKRARIPVLVRGDSHLQTPRGIAKRAGKAVVYPLALRAFDAALYVGERSRRYWEHYRYPSHRMFFSPHCVDNDWFAARATPSARAQFRAAYGITNDAPVALFAGKLVSFKRPLDLIQAAARARSSTVDLTVLVAGSGPLADEMTKMSASMGVKLVHLGFCNQSQMPLAYAAADVLNLPSNGFETWGLVANEALACGVPVIVSDACGCAPDLAADGSAGRVVPVGDIDALASALNALLRTPVACQAIRAKAARYSVRAAADGVERAMRVTARQRREKA